MNRIYSIMAVIGVLFFSCTKKLENPGATNTVTMSNEWWVTLKLGTDDLLGTHVLFATYNTSKNVSDSLWLDDLGNGYQFKCKVLANPKSLTFNTDSSQNEYYDVRVHITNGKIIPNGGFSKTGLVTDSIYMEASFGDDPGDMFIISGTARTRWANDDYN
jgi:Lipid-binding putative hydrolase